MSRNLESEWYMTEKSQKLFMANSAFFAFWFGIRKLKEILNLVCIWSFKTRNYSLRKLTHVQKTTYYIYIINWISGELIKRQLLQRAFTWPDPLWYEQLFMNEQSIPFVMWVFSSSKKVLLNDLESFFFLGFTHSHVEEMNWWKKIDFYQYSFLMDLSG